MADTTRRATLIISAKDEASQQIGENSFKFTELNSAVELAKKGIEAFKQIYDFAEQGAALQRIGEQWKATAEQFGVNADETVKAIDKATNGTVDDEEIMKVATRALTQNVVANGQQLTDFFGIARAMTVRFGGDIVANTQAIDMAIETGMTRQLKARGIVVNFTEAYKDYADQLGVAVSALDDETKMQIRRNEVLKEGEVLVKKVGDTGADAATKYEQFNRNMGELGDTLKTVIATAFTPTIEKANFLLTAQQQLTDEEIYHEKAIRTTSATYKDYLIELERSAVLTGNLTYIADDNSRAFARAAYDAGELEGKYALVNDTIYEVSGGLKILQQASFEAFHTPSTDMEDYRLRLRKIAEVTDEVVQSTQQLSDEWKTRLDLTTKITTEDKKFSDSQRDLIQKADDLRIALKNVTKIGTVDNSKETKKIQDDLDGVNKEILANRMAHDEATKHIVFDYAMQQMAVGGFTDVEQAALGSLSAQFGFTSDSAEAMSLKIIGATDQLAKDNNPQAFADNIAFMTGTISDDMLAAAHSAELLHAGISSLQDKYITVNVDFTSSGYQKTQEQVQAIAHGGPGINVNYPTNPNANTSASIPSKPSQNPTPQQPHVNPGESKYDVGGFAPIGTVATVGESGEEFMQVTPYGTNIVPMSGAGKNKQAKSGVTINIYTTQPVKVPYLAAIARAQAGAFN